MKRLIPWVLVAVFAAELVAIMMPKRETGFHTREFGSLPVLLNGRIQPMDSVGRNSLLQIRSTASVPLEETKAWQFWKHPRKLKSSEWLLEVFLKPGQADERNIFLVHHPELLGEFKLEGKGTEKSGLHYFTYNELRPVRDAIHEQALQINGIDEKLRTPVQKQLMKLEGGLGIYERLKNSLRPETTDDFAKQLEEFRQSVGPGVAALRAKEEGKAYDQAAFDRFVKMFNQYYLMANTALPLAVPPDSTDHLRENWRNVGASLIEVARGAEIPPAVSYYAALATAYRQSNPDDFNRAVAGYRDWLTQQNFGSEAKKGSREFFFNNLQPFLHSMITYICAFLLAFASLLTLRLWPNASETLRRSAVFLVVFAWIVHTGGLIFRIALEGRPPVTNLYSSAVFIGWGAVLLCVLLERIYKVGIGVAVAAFGGFVTLIIAHNLALGGDTMEMLQAVLDTNFWLATHVTVVTLGYASTFVAGMLAVTYIFLGLLTRVLAVPVSNLNVGKMLGKMVYGIVCFATLFSFTGTVLGGIWADQSWGRFWGWDPKENGALIIVIWNAAILHARWGGIIRERGLMNMAVFGNIVTSWSWFGTNMLGIGLHSYGFMDRAFWWLMVFMGSQLVIIALGSLPLRFWLSFRPATPAPGATRPGTVRGKVAPATP